MTNILLCLIILLAIVAAVQLANVFLLAAELRGQKTYEVTERDNRMNGMLMMAFVISFFSFCFWQFIKYKNTLLPHAASEQGVELDWLFNFNIIIISFVFIVTNILLFYFAYKYSGRKNSKAFFYPQNHRLELVWTIVPAVVLSVIIFLGIKLWNNITAIPQGEMVIIELYAKQFDWTARYAGSDGVLGHADYKKITDLNITGMDSADQHAWDDVVVKNEFHIPVGKTVQFICRSRDVIHSAYLPHFRAQMNCVPGMTTQMHFVPTITTDSMRKRPEVIRKTAEINERRIKEGKDSYAFDYILLCNKICGASHYGMQMTIVVEPEEQYKEWLAAKKSFFSKEVTAGNNSVANSETKTVASNQ